MNAKKHLTQIVTEAGITINGNNPWDIQIRDEAVYQRIFRNGRLALGESYMDGQWDCEDLTEAYSRLLTSGAQYKLRSFSTLLLTLRAKFFNLQSRKRAYQVGEKHYDLGNELYEKMLGSHMQYTCNLWQTGARNLDEAEEAKLELICKKLDLKSGKRLLDIGCGWGNLMKYAAKNYGVECTGISVSKEQTAWANERFENLPCKIKIVDYRDFKDSEGFDYITSIEMIEAVGPKNFKTYFEKIHSLSKENGKILIQAIISKDRKPKAEPWINKYIFPNGIFPSAHQLEQATSRLFHWENLENIGLDYEHTLLAWWDNLEKAYPQLHKNNHDKFDGRFLRMFRYYLLACAANVRTKGMYDWQLVMTKK